MKILGFDTATDMCTVALYDEESTVELNELAPRKHTEFILPMVREVLHKKKLKLTELDAIAFGVGPGSFMGSRLAASVAQGLSFPHQIPVIKVSTLQALAQHAYTTAKCKQVVAAWDARMNEMYCGYYHLAKGDIMQATKADALIKPGDFKQMGDDFMYVGNAFQAYASVLPKLLPKKIINLYPSAKALLTIAQQYYADGQTVLSKDALPYYYRDAV